MMSAPYWATPEPRFISICLRVGFLAFLALPPPPPPLAAASAAAAAAASSSATWPASHSTSCWGVEWLALIWPFGTLDGPSSVSTSVVACAMG